MIVTMPQGKIIKQSVPDTCNLLLQTLMHLRRLWKVLGISERDGRILVLEIQPGLSPVSGSVDSLIPRRCRRFVEHDARVKARNQQIQQILQRLEVSHMQTRQKNKVALYQLG